MPSAPTTQTPITIGFIGGCINFPFGVNADKTYHALLCNRLPGAKIKLARYITYSSMVGSVAHFIKEESPTVLVLFIRHFPYMVLNKPLIKLAGKDGVTTYKLHPNLLNRGLAFWPQALDKYAVTAENNRTPKRNYIGLRDVNSLIGKGLGLHNWAMRYAVKSIHEIVAICAESNTQLIVVGPTKNPETYMGDKVCTRLNQHIKAEMHLSKIPFVDINVYTDAMGNPLFQADKIHFNDAGHSYLSSQIMQKLQQYVALTAVNQS